MVGLDPRIDRSGFNRCIREYFPSKADRAEILTAFDRAVQAHDGQMRMYEDLPYVTHPIAVSIDVTTAYEDKELTIAALLHDVVEDCDVETHEVYERYGDAVGLMVEAVTKIPLYFVREPETVYADKIEKLLAGGMQDVRVLLLKIADRDHNLRTLEDLKPKKQIKMTFETQAIYEPLRQHVQGGSIEATHANLESLLLTYGFSTPAQFKKHLFSITYEAFDNDMFNLAYANTDKIVWEVESLEWFKSLMKQKNFAENVVIQNIETDGNNSSVRFTFIKGGMLGNTGDEKVSAYNLTTE